MTEEATIDLEWRHSRSTANHESRYFVANGEEVNFEISLFNSIQGVNHRELAKDGYKLMLVHSPRHKEQLAVAKTVKKLKTVALTHYKARRNKR